jgi:catabolite regulation protein CreA
MHLYTQATTPHLHIVGSMVRYVSKEVFKHDISLFWYTEFIFVGFHEKKILILMCSYSNEKMRFGSKDYI